MAKGSLTHARTYERRRRRKTASNPVRAERNGKGTASGLWRRKSIRELAAEQGVMLEGQLERIWGSGAHLWESDEEFERFVQEIYDRRREDRDLSKR